jgi:hypothetical protein
MHHPSEPEVKHRAPTHLGEQGASDACCDAVARLTIRPTALSGACASTTLQGAAEDAPSRLARQFDDVVAVRLEGRNTPARPA